MPEWISRNIHQSDLMSVNLREQALKAIEDAKADLSRDKYLVPVALVVTEDGLSDFTLDFENSDQKLSAYRELVNIARVNNARAIITVNDARISGPSDFQRLFSTPGNANEGAGSDCIFVTVSGPAIRTWTVCLPYERIGDNFAFGSPNETFDDFLNLLPGWPVDQKGVS